VQEIREEPGDETIEGLLAMEQSLTPHLARADGTNENVGTGESLAF
jgi:hypothetical protein